MIQLPSKKAAAKATNPITLVMYAPPKAWKTTVVSKLDDCLLVDLEWWSNYVDAMSVQINSLQDIKDLAAAIKKAWKPYKYIAVDTLTKLEEYAEELALEMYKETPLGKNYTWSNILNLPNWWWYHWLRLAFVRLQNAFKSMAKYVIFIAHIKDKKITTDWETEMLSTDINLTGKLANIVASYSDWIWQLKRIWTETYLSFVASELNPLMWCRSPHLSWQEFLLSEKLEDGNIVTYRDKIYLSWEDNVPETDNADIDSYKENDESITNVIDQVIENTPKRNVWKKKQEADAKKKDEGKIDDLYVSPSWNKYPFAESSAEKMMTFIISSCEWLSEQDAYDKFVSVLLPNNPANWMLPEIRKFFTEYFE